MNDRSIAYFSMEIALSSSIPTYAGGLGILAGDTIRSAADLKVPMVAVTLLHRKGYLLQRLDSSGWQREDPAVWGIDHLLVEMPERVTVFIQGRPVQVRSWKYEVKGVVDFAVPVLLLDTDLPENSAWDRTLTDYLYGGEQLYRLCQEMILGMGGVRILRALGFRNLLRFHMNEGHASLLTLELLSERVKAAGRTAFNESDIQAVRQMCIFTTHTPVAAGHDQFPIDLIDRVLGSERDILSAKNLFCTNRLNHLAEDPDGKTCLDHCAPDQILNMTRLALNLSHYVNGVAKKHGEISRAMFAGYEIDAITNGVHADTWTCESIQALFDHYLSGWRQDNFSLRYAHAIPIEALISAHLAAKRRLIKYVNSFASQDFGETVFTIGCARRATLYKRADLVLRDVPRFKRIASRVGQIQLIFGGKAHPNDHGGKEMIQRIVQLKESLLPEIKLVYLENYDIEQAKLLTSGCDLWLNTPLPPMEASGTSGMKAALNGVPSCSVLDGWWVEGWVEGETGWAIGENCDKALTGNERSECDANSLYEKLERVILPLFHEQPNQYADVMRHCISLNGSFFNTQRMVQQYVLKAYFE